MLRYIEADALNAAIEEWFDGVCVYDVSPSEAVNDFQSIVDEQPTVSPDEVRGAGTWLRKEKVRHNLDGDGDYRYECSACGHSDEHNENVHVPFCWYCGAKMEVDGNA